MISIVVPVFNEEESLEAFYAELVQALLSLKQEYEILFIDDGSTDRSFAILNLLHKKDKRIHIFSFRRNLGKAEALTFGFIKARGDFIVTLDADLQDKPSEIGKLLQKSKEGVEVVCGWRRDRRDKSHMKLISKIFNGFLQRFFDVKIHDYNCGLKVYTKEAAKSLRLYGGLHRFIPLMLYQLGFTVDEVAVDHQERKFGTSKYGFSKLWKDLPDMFTMIFLAKYSKRPLHFFGVVGSILFVVGVLFLSYLTMLHYFFGQTVGERPILFIGILFVISGLQILFTGFLADLIINISHSPKMLDEEHMHFPLRYNSDKSK